jgi:tRNA pseudouridine38-40 synthase
VRIPRALNSILPDDIICKKAVEVSKSFHARYLTRGKKYRYRIINRPYSSVFVRNFVYNLRQPLDFSIIKQVIQQFEGTHEFASFQDSGGDKRNTVRTISEIELQKHSSEYWIEVKGNGFLYKMVRIMVGTLIEIGLKKRKPDINQILKSKDRKKAGFTAPAKGLTLVKVYY